MDKEDLSSFEKIEQFRYRDILYAYSQQTDILLKNSNNENSAQVERKWSKKEINALINGIKTYGKGNWLSIYDANKKIFDQKSIDDLEDQYNIMIQKEEKKDNF